MCPGKWIQSQGSHSRAPGIYLPLCCPEGLVPFLTSNCFGQWDIAPAEQMATGNIVPLRICCILLPFLQAFCVVSFAACANKQFVN